MDSEYLPVHKCQPGHCLCNAIVTAINPPDIGQRVQAYSDHWQFITWQSGDEDIFDYWRGDMDSHPCEVGGDIWGLR